MAAIEIGDLAERYGGMTAIDEQDCIVSKSGVFDHRIFGTVEGRRYS